jgi:ribulose bisphosphate carboxylase small subunit
MGNREETMRLTDIQNEEKVRLDPKCWTGKKIGNPKTKMKGGVRVNNCVPAESVEQGVAEGHADQQRKIVKQGGKPVGEIGIDRESSPGNGQWYMKHYASGIDNVGYDSMEEALAELKHCLKQGVAESSNGYRVTWSEAGSDKHTSGLLLKPHAIEHAKMLQKKPGTSNVKVVPYNPRSKEVAEEYNGEYDDEAGMAQGNLYTIAKAAQGLIDTIDDHDNLPEWCQEKIAKVEGMLVSVWNYLQSQKAQGIDPEIEEMYEAMDQLAEEMAQKNGTSADLVWESFEALPDNVLYETAAWQKKSGKNKNGGLNAKGVASYRREHPGSKLQTAVTTKPSKLKPGSKAAKRRKSFCARMSGVKGPMKKPNGKPTRKALALRKWNC